jgi:hypothetical protein
MGERAENREAVEKLTQRIIDQARSGGRATVTRDRVNLGGGVVLPAGKGSIEDRARALAKDVARVGDAKKDEAHRRGWLEVRPAEIRGEPRRMSKRQHDEMLARERAKNRQQFDFDDVRRSQAKGKG